MGFLPTAREPLSRERLKPEVSGLDQDDYTYYLLWAALSSFWARCTEFALSVWHADVLSLISTWDWPRETGGDGAGAGGDGRVTLSISSCAPSVVFGSSFPTRCPRAYASPWSSLSWGKWWEPTVFLKVCPLWSLRITGQSASWFRLQSLGNATKSLLGVL